MFILIIAKKGSTFKNPPPRISQQKGASRKHLVKQHEHPKPKWQHEHPFIKLSTFIH